MKNTRYTYSLPTSISFDGKGLFGYTFGPLNQRDVEIYYIEVEKGHDTFMVSKRITRIYYILCGSGYFTIADRKYDVSPGMLVEVPPKVEYSYSGKMKLIAFSKPRWFVGNDTLTKWNPDVVRARLPLCSRRWILVEAISQNEDFSENRRLAPIYDLISYCGTNFLRPLPLLVQYAHMAISCMRWLEYKALARKLSPRFFLRNRPQLELIRRLAEQQHRC